MNLLEKFFYISLGLTTDLGKKLSESLDSMVKDSKISEIDARKIKEDFRQATERYAGDIRKKFDELLKNTLENMRLVHKSELDKVRKRIEDLEKKIDALD